jgi:hypothetical protein
VRKVLPRRARDLQPLVGVTDGNDESDGLLGTRRVQQVEARRIAEVHLEADTSQHVHPIAVHVEHYRPHAVGTQQPPRGTAELSETGDDDRALMPHLVAHPRDRRRGRSTRS